MYRLITVFFILNYCCLEIVYVYCTALGLPLYLWTVETRNLKFGMDMHMRVLYSTLYI